MTYQTAMFTTEQMKGTGQTNMLDLIQDNEDRIQDLRVTPHTYWHDPSHGWLEVSYKDLLVLGISGAITGCSYRNGDKVYLEEDMDATTYIKALFGDKMDNPLFSSWKTLVKSQYGDSIFIRNLNRYRP